MQLTLPQKCRLQAKILRVYAQKTFSLRSMERIVRDIILGTDTATIRILLANASLVWAIMLMTQPWLFQHEMFDIMRVIASQPIWVAAFIVHFLGVYWAVYQLDPKPNSGITINAFGFLLWFFTTVSTNYYEDAFFNPGTALEMVLCGASAWALYKTGSAQGMSRI